MLKNVLMILLQSNRMIKVIVNDSFTLFITSVSETWNNFNLDNLDQSYILVRIIMLLMNLLNDITDCLEMIFFLKYFFSSILYVFFHTGIWIRQISDVSFCMQQILKLCILCFYIFIKNITSSVSYKKTSFSIIM